MLVLLAGVCTAVSTRTQLALGADRPQPAASAVQGSEGDAAVQGEAAAAVCPGP